MWMRVPKLSHMVVFKVTLWNFCYVSSSFSKRDDSNTAFLGFLIFFCFVIAGHYFIMAKTVKKHGNLLKTLYLAAC